MYFHPLSEPGMKGAESLEFYFSSHFGENARPLRKTASGGELSRVLLALKQVFAGRASSKTYVFDEVDTGIGGAVAEVVGREVSLCSAKNSGDCSHTPTAGCRICRLSFSCV